MAQVPYQGSPDSQAPAEAPSDYQSVSTSPATFGGAVAEGAQAAGQGLLDASHFYNQVAADNSTNNAVDAVGNIFHGEPGKMVVGPDGQMTQDTGFLGKRGQDAMVAYPDAVKSLDEAIQEQRSSLSTPAAKLQFDNDTRRMRAGWISQMGNHYDQQSFEWVKDTNNTAITQGLNAVSQVAGDDAASDAAGERVRNASVKLAQAQYGVSDEVTQGALLKADQQITLTRYDKLVANPATAVKAQQLLDEKSDILGSMPNYGVMIRQAQNAVFDATSGPALDNFVSDTVNKARGMVGTPTGASQPAQDYSAVPFTDIKAKLQADEGPSHLGGYNAQVYNTSPTTNAVGLKPVDLTGMTIGQVMDYQHNVMTPATVGHRGANDPGTTAVGAYQFERGTLQAQAQATLGPNWRDQPFSAPNQDLMAEHLYNSVRGNGDTLAKTWPGLAGGAGSGGAGTFGYPTTADALNANRSNIEDQLRAVGQQKYAGHPEQVEQFVTLGLRRVDQKITQQTRMQEVNAHIVQSWVAQNNPISTQEIMNGPPDVVAAYNHTLSDDPTYAIRLNNMLDANAHGRATSNGSQFYSYFDRAMAPASDPNRIANSGQLSAVVGKDENSPLTNTGVGALTDLMGLRGTPQGESQVATIKASMDAIHSQLSYSNASAGLVDQKGEAQFDKFASAVLPIVLRAAKAGNLTQMLDPKSPDYIGRVAQGLARTPAQIVADRLAGEGYKPERGDLPITTPQGLQMAVGRISPHEATWISNRMGFPYTAPATTPKMLTPNPTNAIPMASGN